MTMINSLLDRNRLPYLFTNKRLVTLNKMAIFKFKRLRMINSFCRSYHWVKPEGRETGVRVYNPISKCKELLVSKNASYLSWYSCGPTVYDVTHIGHASSYVRLDIINRVLRHWFGVKPIIALGMTDIDDKIIAKSKAVGVDFNEIAQKYELEFFRDLKRLNVSEPHFVLRVTEHVPEIINFIKIILEKGHGYVLNGEVYFNTASLPDYGKITRAPVVESNEPKEGQRLNPSDFALWKASKPGEPSWPSPWSPGRPGWHIECSAMASKIFGKDLDVHAGGLDLAFPHHENEEAQSCAYHTVDQWVNYWLHTGHLLMNGMKMSKSMKNFIPIETFLNEHSADDFRMLCLTTHYRTSIDYTPEVLKKSKVLVKKFETFCGDAKSYCRGSWRLGQFSGPELIEFLETSKKKINDYLADDFNTAQCINQLEELVKMGNLMMYADPVSGSSSEVVAITQLVDYLEEVLSHFGLLHSNEEMESKSQSYIIDKTLEFRETVRGIALLSKEKSSRADLLKACDTLRSDLNAINISVKDTLRGAGS